MTRLSIERLTKSYAGSAAVSDLDLEIEPGQLVVLLGPSGCGKTTTLRCIAGLEDVSAGRILMDGIVVSSCGVSIPPERRSIGMVFQSYAIWPHLNVVDNVAYGLRLKGLPRPEVAKRVASTLELVGLTGYEERSASALSGGQQQRVALARAIALQPKVLLFDEPLSNLDAKLRQRMRLEIRALQRRLGITSVYVTHDQEEAMVVGDLIVLMKDGRIEQSGAPQEIYDRPVSLFAAEFIGSANVFQGILDIAADGSCAVAYSPDGRLAVAANAGQAGSSVDIIVRPEHLVVATEPPDHQPFGARTMRGTVVESVFVGAFSEIVVDIGPTVLRAHVTPARKLTTGTPVWLSIPPHHVLTLRKGTARSHRVGGEAAQQ